MGVSPCTEELILSSDIEINYIPVSSEFRSVWLQKHKCPVQLSCQKHCKLKFDMTLYCH